MNENYLLESVILMDNPAIYSHRGASAYALENSWNAFLKACELNVGIELDVQITKDGVVLVFHDDDLKRLGGRKLSIAEVDYGEIKDTKIGRRGRRRFSGDRIPLAYEVLQWAKSKSVPLNIEIKESFAIHPDGPGILAAMLEGMGDIHLSSFNPELLRSMKELKPDMEMALIIKNKSMLKRLDKMDWVDSIHLSKRIYSDKLLERLENMNKTIRIYGIVGKEKALNRLSSSVSGIITDYPDKVKEKLNGI